MLCEKCKIFIGGSKDLQREQEETLRFIAQQYSTKEILNLLGVSYSDLDKVKADYEFDFVKGLQDMLNSRPVDRSDGIPFNLNHCIDYLELPYKSSISFKRMLANGTMPVEHIEKAINFINDDYRPRKFN